MLRANLLCITEKPSRPHLDDEGNRLKNLLDPEVSRVDQGIDLTCYAEGGQPQPQFKWFIGKTAEFFPCHSG